MLEANDPIFRYTPLWGIWQAQALIGEGSYGRVYRIAREDIGGSYYSALKHIHIPQSAAEVEQAKRVGMDEASLSLYFGDMASRIVSEINTMYTLRGQPNIVAYEDHLILHAENSLEWDVFLRMELLQPLPEYLESHSLSPAGVRRLGAELCAALAACARKWIIHRDIKDGNVFITEDGVFKLGDFGVARTMLEQTRSMTMRGTPVYLAPEVFHGQAYDARVDLYSLGILLYKLLNDKRYPFLPAAPAPIGYGDVEKAFATRMQGTPVPPPAHGDAALHAIVCKACSYRPEDRFQSAEEMLLTLQKDAPPAPAPQEAIKAAPLPQPPKAILADSSAPAPKAAVPAPTRKAVPQLPPGIWKKGMLAMGVLAGILTAAFLLLLRAPVAEQPAPPHYSLPYDPAGILPLRQDTPLIMQELPPMQGYVSALYAILHEFPAPGTALAAFPQHTRLTITGESGDWYYADAGGASAYFRKADVAEGEPPPPEPHPTGGLSLGYEELQGTWVLEALTSRGQNIELVFSGNRMTKTLREGVAGDIFSIWEGTYAISGGDKLLPCLSTDEYLSNGSITTLLPRRMGAIEIISISEDTLVTSTHTFRKKLPGQPDNGGPPQAV